MSPTRILALTLAALLTATIAAQPPAPQTAATPRYATLPPMPSPVPGSRSATAAVNGIRLFYTDTGRAQPGAVPVILLHGGLANQQYWGNQIRALSPGHRTIAIDSRGHGRSTRDTRPYGYDLMADDVLALMDSLHIPQADLVGWSDGAIISLDLAMRHPTRVRRVFSFAANSVTTGLIPDGDKSPNFAHFIQRAGSEYRAISPKPTEYEAFVAQITHMWDDQPHWTDAQLQSIHAPVLIADGDHDEVIRRDHTEYLAHTIPGAGLLLLPNASHFAFLQDPTLFNAALLDFLDQNLPAKP